MAVALKDLFGPEMVHRAATSIAAVYDGFDSVGFTAMALEDFEELDLTPRCRQIAAAMAAYLPADRERAIDILVDSLGPELENRDPAAAVPSGDPEVADDPMSGFFYVPHGYFVAHYCADHFDAAMHACYEITKRATSEFGIRTLLRDHTEASLDVLSTWATDENVHVRRLVSEGTRPRLPWSFRLTAFEDDPSPVLALLEKLKDDPVEYVRRSVANNLNDIAKDHPGVVVEVARRWWADGDENRRRLIRHALRTLVKAGDPAALDVLGFGADSPAVVGDASIEPSVVGIGAKVAIEVSIDNPSPQPCRVLVDLRVHFVKANGTTSPKVFKGAELCIDPRGSATVRKTVSVAQHSTRKHHPGDHPVEVMINGRIEPIGKFTVVVPT